MRKSDCFLCPATITQKSDEEHIAYIEVLSTSGTPGYEKYFEEVAEAWMKLDGVPHWHKQFTFLNNEDRDIYKYIRDQFGDHLEKFRNVRTSLNLDPDDIFLNETMKKIIKP